MAGEGDDIYSSGPADYRPRRRGVAPIALSVFALIAFAPAAPSLATTPVPSGVAGPWECKPGRECTVEGVLWINRFRSVTTSRIDTAAGCFAVALTDKQRKAVRNKHGGFARVTGTGYLYSWRTRWRSYRIADRTVGNGGCPSGTMLYARQVEATR